MKFIEDSLYKSLIHSQRWINLRNEYIRQHPICENCHDRLSEEVHHKDVLTRYRNDYAMMERKAFDPDNLLAVCHICHEDIHRQLGKGRHHKEDIKKLNEEKVNSFIENWLK